MDFDIRRSLRQAHRRVFVEVALHGAAAIDGDLVAHQVAEPFNHPALHLVERAAGIDDLAADVTGDPYLVDANFVARLEADFGDLRALSAVAESDGHAPSGVFRHLRRSPT